MVGRSAVRFTPTRRTCTENRPWPRPHRALMRPRRHPRWSTTAGDPPLLSLEAAAAARRAPHLTACRDGVSQRALPAVLIRSAHDRPAEPLGRPAAAVRVSELARNSSGSAPRLRRARSFGRPAQPAATSCSRGRVSPPRSRGVSQPAATRVRRGRRVAGHSRGRRRVSQRLPLRSGGPRGVCRHRRRRRPA
eukprot:351599-Chlamydomonas_euryale.AAC.11